MIHELYMSLKKQKKKMIEERAGAICENIFFKYENIMYLKWYSEFYFYNSISGKVSSNV